MQDRFKFRIFDKERERMFYPEKEEEHIEIDYNGDLIGIDKEYIWIGGFNCIPMQCTGLKDKNGKLIYEGDICHNVKTDEIVTIGWHGTMAGYVWSKPKYSHIFDFGALFRAYDKLEIIGNIYENADLLRGEE